MANNARDAADRIEDRSFMLFNLVEDRRRRRRLCRLLALGRPDRLSALPPYRLFSNSSLAF